MEEPSGVYSKGEKVVVAADVLATGSTSTKKSSSTSRKIGRRCNAYGCSNTSRDGFFVHDMPGKMPSGSERFSPLQKSWVDFIGRKRKFDTKDAKKYQRISLCSGHFTEDD